MADKTSLLVEIRDAAVDGVMPLTTLLRKCQVLASQLDNADFKQWTSRELNGYPNVKSVPAYRKIKVQSLGNFAGAFGRTMTHAPIPLYNLSPKEQEALSHSVFVDGVGTIEGLLTKENGNGQLTEPWPAEFIGFCAGKFYQNFNLIQAYKVVPRSAVSGILEIIRNRILEFSLQLLEVLPEGETLPSKDEESKTSVQNIFNTYILGDGNRVAAGCGSVKQNVTKFEKGNWAYLEGVLKQLKVAQDDITELKQLLKANPPKSKSKLGDGVNGWLGGVAAKAAQAGYDIPIGIGLAAILKYCGLN